MPTNFDGTSAELQPDKYTEEMNNRKNKEKTLNEVQISRKGRTKEEKLMG